MLLTITNLTPPATDLGFLLHKHPERVQRFSLAFGHARIFYPESSEERCTAAMMLEVDPVGLVRNRKGPDPAFTLEQYVNDRPYAASSMLSVAISRVFGTALGGHCATRPELPERRLRLRACLPVVPSRGGPAMLERLFGPLGYQVGIERHPLDPSFPEWGEGPYCSLELTGQVRLQDLLSHLYVLVPVLDNDKHYWVGESEVDKLMRHGERWLADHPERELIAQRYLKHRRNLVDAALSRLLDEDVGDLEVRRESRDQEEEAVEKPLRLNDVRLDLVVATLGRLGAQRVLDLGCGEGKLVQRLLQDKSFKEITGVDVSHRALEIAQRRLHWDRMPDRQRERIRLLHGSLTYRDRRLEGYDAAAAIEVIEHLEPSRLGAFERALFEFTRPQAVVVTTPNREYNVRFESLPAGRLRHRDHRFEWTRSEFAAWARRVGEAHGYVAELHPVGPEDPELGAPTQMAVLTR